MLYSVFLLAAVSSTLEWWCGGWWIGFSSWRTRFQMQMGYLWLNNYEVALFLQTLICLYCFLVCIKTFLTSNLVSFINGCLTNPSRILFLMRILSLLLTHVLSGFPWERSWTQGPQLITRTKGTSNSPQIDILKMIKLYLLQCRALLWKHVLFHLRGWKLSLVRLLLAPVMILLFWIILRSVENGTSKSLFSW